jgi:proteic killer suppression protein
VSVEVTTAALPEFSPSRPDNLKENRNAFDGRGSLDLQLRDPWPSNTNRRQVLRLLEAHLWVCNRHRSNARLNLPQAFNITMLFHEANGTVALYTTGVYIRAVIQKVVLSKQAQKDLTRVPRHIALNLRTWVESVEADGLEEVRKIPGYHDEPLKGQRAGQRSIRLSKAYRAIYVVGSAGEVEFVRVEEVSKHEY